MSDNAKHDALEEILPKRPHSVAARKLVGPAPQSYRREQHSAPRKGPDKFTYALQQYAAERRSAGWYVAPTVFGDETQKWTGPFESIENACLAIARRHATELADRHTRSIEHHKIKKGAPLYGLKSTTGLT